MQTLTARVCCTAGDDWTVGNNESVMKWSANYCRCPGCTGFEKGECDECVTSHSELLRTENERVWKKKQEWEKVEGCDALPPEYDCWMDVRSRQSGFPLFDVGVRSLPPPLPPPPSLFSVTSFSSRLSCGSIARLALSISECKCAFTCTRRYRITTSRREGEKCRIALVFLAKYGRVLSFIFCSNRRVKCGSKRASSKTTKYGGS